MTQTPESRINPDDTTLAPVDTNDTVIDAIAKAIAEPAQVTPPSSGEPFARWSARAVIGILPTLGEIRPAVDQAELNEILNAAGIEYPLGLRGVRDLVDQRDGHLEAARETEAELTELRALKARLDEKRDSLALDHSNGRLVDMLDRISGDLA